MVHRRGEEILRAELPPKREVVLKLALTPTQARVYTSYVEGTAEAKCRSVFADATNLCMVSRQPAMAAPLQGEAVAASTLPAPWRRTSLSQALALPPACPALQLCDRPSDFRAWLETVVAQGRAAAAALPEHQPTPAVAEQAGPAAAATAPDEEFQVVLGDDFSSSTGGHSTGPDTSPARSDAVSGKARTPLAAADVGSTGFGAVVLAVEQAAAAAAGPDGAAGMLAAASSTDLGKRPSTRKFPLALAETLLEMVEVGMRWSLLGCMQPPARIWKGDLAHRRICCRASWFAGRPARGVLVAAHQQAVGSGAAAAMVCGERREAGHRVGEVRVLLPAAWLSQHRDTDSPTPLTRLPAVSARQPRVSSGDRAPHLAHRAAHAR